MTELEAVQSELKQIKALLQSRLLPAPDPGRLWSVQDVAVYFNVSVKTAYNDIIHRPWFPKPVRGDGEKRFDPQEVIEAERMNRGRLS